MNLRRMRELAARLEKVPLKKFDMGSVFSKSDGWHVPDMDRECGTTACIAGWVLHWFATDEQRNEYKNRGETCKGAYEIAGKILGLSRRDAKDLFEAQWRTMSGPWQDAWNASPQQAAAEVRAMISDHEEALR